MILKYVPSPILFIRFIYVYISIQELSGCWRLAENFQHDFHYKNNVEDA